MTRRYFDWAATAIPDEIPAPEKFGNPSALHFDGREAKEALENARKDCAFILGVEPEQLYFTSGGTEANAIVLFSLLLRPQKVKALYSAVEHPSVIENCHMLERFGISCSAIPAENDGRISSARLKESLEKFKDVRFAAIMAVNNETGSVNDLNEIRDIIHEKQTAPIHFHSDLVQAAGKIPLDLNGWGLDSASISAHKIGGQKGIGLLYLRKPIETLFSGGAQERKIRPGTENLSGALSMAASLKKHAGMQTLTAALKDAQDRMKFLINGLKKIDSCSLIPADRNEEDLRFSPWILQLRIGGIPGEVLLRALDTEGFSVSTGAACSSASGERPVLSAMGLDGKASLEGIRISQGYTTAISDIESLLNAIIKIAGIYK